MRFLQVSRLQVWALAFCLFVSQAHAGNMTLLGVGKPVAAATFSGSGDVLAGAFAYWSCARAYTAAYASGGGNACDVQRTSDSATCTVKFASSGYADVSTAYCSGNTQSVTAFCNATTCKITKAYDQSGATNCSGSVACHATEATGANQPTLNLSGLNSKLCMTFAGGQDLTTPALASGQAQPISASFVSERTGAFTSFSAILGDSASGNVQFLYNNAANQGGIYSGNINSSQQVSMSDSAYHALQMIVNDPSSIVVVDGSATSGLGSGSDTPGTASKIIGNGNNALTGSICEVRIDAGAYNATQYGNLNSNQHGTSGYNF